MEMPKHFSRKEFACECGCGFDTVDYELMIVLEDVREHFKKPVTISSGCRCKKHNQKVNGSLNSLHIIGRAADIQIAGVKPSTVHTYLTSKYPFKYGIGSYPTFTHIDTRDEKAARWNG